MNVHPIEIKEDRWRSHLAQCRLVKNKKCHLCPDRKRHIFELLHQKNALYQLICL